MYSGFIHIIAYISNSFLYCQKKSVVWICTHLSVHQLMDIWIVSSLELLWILIFISLSGHVIRFFLGSLLGMESLGHVSSYSATTIMGSWVRHRATIAKRLMSRHQALPLPSQECTSHCHWCETWEQVPSTTPTVPGVCELPPPLRDPGADASSCPCYPGSK